MNTEKRFFLALGLSIIIVMVYPHFLRLLYPSLRQAPPPRREAAAPSPGVPAAPATGEPAPQAPASPPPAQPAAEEKKFDYEDNAYRITFTNLGGGIDSLSLKKFGTGKVHGNVLIEDREGVPAGFSVRLLEEGRWLEGVFRLEQKERLTVSQAWEASESFLIRKSYYFIPEQYAFALEIHITNLAPLPRQFNYELVAPLFTGSVAPNDRHYIELDYVSQDHADVQSLSKVAKQPYLKSGPLDWFALENKYFTVIVKPQMPVEYVRTIAEKDTLLNFIKPHPAEIAPGSTLKHQFLVYAGPKDHSILKSQGAGFEKILHTRFLGGLWILFLIMLKFFSQIFHNYGVAIIVLSSLIKLAFAPLTHMSFESMRKMQALQPKIKALQEQYKKDPQKLNQEVMELYKRNKVNPFGGCLPLLLQMPIFVALYQTFSQAIELRGAPFFWWIKDLSEPDQLYLLPMTLPLLGNQINVLPIIMLGTMVWQQKLTPQTAATKDQQMIMNLMPVIFGFVFYGLPSGLVIYWIVNNLLTIFHQLFMKKLHITPAH